MKNLYGWSDMVEEKLDFSNEESVAKALEEKMDFDPCKDTLGSLMAKLFNYAFGIPVELWNKKLIDFTEEDAALMDAMETELITFTRS